MRIPIAAARLPLAPSKKSLFPQAKCAVQPEPSGRSNRISG